MSKSKEIVKKRNLTRTNFVFIWQTCQMFIACIRWSNHFLEHF